MYIYTSSFALSLLSSSSPHFSDFTQNLQHTWAYTSAHVSIREHTWAYVTCAWRWDTLNIRQHTSAYVSMREDTLPVHDVGTLWTEEEVSIYISIRQHAWAYVSCAWRWDTLNRRGSQHIRQHTWAYVSICEHTSPVHDVGTLWTEEELADRSLAVLPERVFLLLAA